MSYELRRPQFNLSGTLTNGCSALDTSLASTVFTSLPTDYSPGSYLPLVLANDTQGKSEIVWVTGHSSAASSVTVVRGREGTSAQAFSAGDVVRCSPTLRDVLSPVTTRSALPTDAHYGMRVLILDEGQVVERTSAGWDDSAPLEADPARRHHWSLTGAPLSTVSSLVTIAGWSAAGNHTGSIATLSGNSQFLLNVPGDWRLKIAMFGSSTSNRNQGVALDWTNGAYLAKPYQIVGAFGGSGAAGNGLVETVWEGYVNAAQAAAPITCQAFSTVALTGCQYDFIAEYMGR